MKRLIAMLLLAILTLCPVAMAGEGKTYEDPNWGYSVAVPDGWIPMTQEGIDAIMEAMKDPELGWDQEKIDQSIALCKDTGIFMAYAPDLSANVNVIAQEMSAPLDAQTMITLFAPGLLEQYKNTFGSDVEQLDVEEVVSAGGKEYAHVAFTYEMAGVSMVIEQFYCCPTGLLYCITFTVREEDYINGKYAEQTNEILASLREGAQSGETVRYVDPTWGYTVEIPEGWEEMTEENKQTVLELMEEMDLGQDRTAVENAIATYESSGMLMVYAPNFSDNLNIVGQELGVPMDAQTMVDSLFESFMAQYVDLLGESVARVEADEVVSLGGKEFAHMVISYVLNDTPLRCEQFFYCPSGTIYILTLTTSDSDDPQVAAYRAQAEEIVASLAE